jgi:hypothetical protein
VIDTIDQIINLPSQLEQPVQPEPEIDPGWAALRGMGPSSMPSRQNGKK